MCQVELTPLNSTETQRKRPVSKRKCEALGPRDPRTGAARRTAAKGEVPERRVAGVSVNFGLCEQRQRHPESMYILGSEVVLFMFAVEKT